MQLGYLFRRSVERVSEWETGTFQFLLLDGTITYDLTAQQYVDDVSSYELTDVSYSRQAVSGATVTYSGSMAVFDCGDPTFPLLDGATAPRWLVVAYDTGVDAADQLIAAAAISHTPDGLDFTPSISPAGFFQIGDAQMNLLSTTSGI